MSDERWILLDLHDLARLMNGRKVPVKVRGSDIRLIIWGAQDVQRIAADAKKHLGEVEKEAEKPNRNGDGK